MAQEHTIPTIPPPPDRHDFESFEDAIIACQSWARDHGYALKKGHTTRIPGTSLYKYVYMHCDRGGKYKKTANIRRTATQKCDCLFQLRISYAGNTSFICTKIINPTHNHLPSWTPKAHAIHRKRDQFTKNAIRAEVRAGVKPKQIMTRLQQEDPSLLIRRKDVYNEVLEARKRMLMGKTPVEALILALEDTDKWVFDFQTDSQNRLTHLFFTYRKIIKIFQSHPDILMADCTYRTNRFKMPLLHFIGCSSIGTHYTAAFCFLPSERQNDYLWALERVRELLYQPINYTPKVFLSDNEEALRSACSQIWPDIPRLLCLWHVNKNVQDRLQKHFKQAIAPFDPTEADKNEQRTTRNDFMSAWAYLNWAKTEIQYEERWADLLNDYREFRPLIRYLKDIQYPQRKEVASPWTSHFRHYNNVTTSKLESSHKQAKACLLHSNGHLLDVVDKLVNYWDDAYHEYAAKLATQFIKIPSDINATLIEEWSNDLNSFITPYALRQCRQQLEKARTNKMAPRCTGRFTKIWGIPCCHDLRAWAQAKRPVRADDFDTHWLWERQGIENVFQREGVASQVPTPTIFDPQVVIAKGRPRRDQSTRRDLSAFELSDPDRQTPGSTPSRTPNRTPNQTPSEHSRSEAGSQTPSIIMSCEPLPPRGPINPALLGAYSPARTTESQPSSAGSTPAPSVSLDIGTPAPTAHLTHQLIPYSPAIGASSTSPSRITGSNKGMQPPPPKRSRGPDITKMRKAETMERITLAWAEIGQPPSIEQLNAMNAEWFSAIDQNKVLAKMTLRLVIIKQPPTPEQIKALKEALPPPIIPI